MSIEIAWAVAAMLAGIAFCVALVAVPTGVYTALFLAFVVAPIFRGVKCLSK